MLKSDFLNRSSFLYVILSNSPNVLMALDTLPPATRMVLYLYFVGTYGESGREREGGMRKRKKEKAESGNQREETIAMKVTVSMELRGPKVRVVSLVISLVKVVCVADMNEVRGESTTAFFILESNTTKGKPPSIAP